MEFTILMNVVDKIADATGFGGLIFLLLLAIVAVSLAAIGPTRRSGPRRKIKGVRRNWLRKNKGRV